VRAWKVCALAGAALGVMVKYSVGWMVYDVCSTCAHQMETSARAVHRPRRQQAAAVLGHQHASFLPRHE